MPHNSIWFPEPEYTYKDVAEFMEKLAEIAQGFGYTTAGGPKSGRGNIRRLLEAIVWGELCLVRCEDHEKVPKESKKVEVSQT